MGLAIFNRKKTISKYPPIDPKIAEQIPSIKTHPEMVAEGDKLEKLRADLVSLRKKIEVHYEGAYVPGSPLPSVEKDAQQILDGIDYSDLPGQLPETLKTRLSRQRSAVEKAIKMQEQNLVELRYRLIREGCLAIKEFADIYVKNTIAAFENVGKCLREQEKFFQHLSMKGYQTDLRDKPLRTLPYEQAVLYGGIYSLDFYLQQRRDSMGLKTKGKKHKH